MTLMTRTFLSATAIGAVFAAPAMAQENWPEPDENATVIVIDQVVLGSTFADMEVIVDGQADGATALSTATGNTATGLGYSGDVDFDASQSQQGQVIATSSLTGGTVYGTASTQTTAYGNAASSSTSDGITFHTPVQNSTSDVEALSYIGLDGADVVTATTTAAANVSSFSAENGEARAFNTQTGSADVTAMTQAELCCNNEAVSLATTASGNTVTGTGSTASTYVGAVQVMHDGTYIYADTEARVGSGHDVTASSTASGNTVSVHNEWGFATAGRDGSVIYQENRAEVDAVSTVELGNWSGTSGATSYGVGNSALISNVGSDTGLYATQQNIGDVTAYASFDAGYSDDGYGFASATAIGNAATATLCTYCASDATLYGQTNQTNYSDTTAIGFATGSGGYIQGAATAVGNSATYQTIGTTTTD